MNNLWVSNISFIFFFKDSGTAASFSQQQLSLCMEILLILRFVKA